MSFQKDFLWCVGGAAAQQDGGYSDGGKGLNIWDALSEGHIKNNDTCHVACDHFHKWKEDFEFLSQNRVCLRFDHVLRTWMVIATENFGFKNFLLQAERRR